MYRNIEALTSSSASQFRVIRQSTKKTDKHDARAIALFLSKNLLPEVRMKDQQHAKLASLTQTRDTLVKQRTAQKNKVNNLLSSQGVSLKKESLGSEKWLREVLGMKFAPLIEIELEVLVERPPPGQSERRAAPPRKTLAGSTANH